MGVVTTGRTNDSDDDGLTNEYEYFFGTDPEDASNQGVNAKTPFASMVTNFPAIEFNYRNDGSVTSYEILNSDDLLSWSTNSWSMAGEGGDWTLVGVDTVGPIYTTTTVRWNNAFPSGKIFFRIKAVE